MVILKQAAHFTTLTSHRYRVFTALFLHAGILHLVVVMIAQLALGFDLERVLGWWRTGFIYFVSGTMGYMARFGSSRL